MRNIKIKVLGQPYSKSNSRIFSSRNKRLFKSKEVLQYVDDSIFQLKPQLAKHRVFEGDVSIEGTIYYRSNRSDLDISLIQDILEQKKDKETGIITFGGVYKNDRQVTHINIRKKIDKENPRFELIISGN